MTLRYQIAGDALHIRGFRASLCADPSRAVLMPSKVRSAKRGTKCLRV